MAPSLHSAAKSLCSGAYTIVEEEESDVEYICIEIQQPDTDTRSSDDDADYCFVNSSPPHASGKSKIGWQEDSLSYTARLWELSDAEASELKELGRRLNDVDHARNTPDHVLRFLRARDGDLKAAEDMFRKMVEWRRSNNVDTILQDYRPPQEMIDYYPGALLEGLDKDNDPIWVSRMGSTDVAEMLHRYGREEMVRQAIWIREMASRPEYQKQYEKVVGHPVKRINIIEDVGGLKLMQFVSNKPLLATYGEIVRLDQDYYPESAKRLFVIRVPRLFKMIWNIVKHFFDPGVVSKMVFCGIHYEKVLSKYMDLEVLPECLVPGVGVGKAKEGMPANFQGGPLPALKEEENHTISRGHHQP